MRAPLAVVTAVATVAAIAVSSPGTATADPGIPGVTATPLPVETTLPLPVETTLPLPGPTEQDPVQDTLGEVSGALPGGDGATGSPGSGTSDPAGDATADTDGGATAGSGGGAAALDGAGPRPARQRARQARDATPVIAGTPAARDLLDDEQSPELLAASREFLAADQAIAEIARQKRLMAGLEQSAEETAALYRAFGFDVATARAAADRLHERHDALRRQVSETARTAYVRGAPAGGDDLVAGLAAALTRYSDGGTRADMRVGDLTVRQAAARADFERIAQRYAEARRRLSDAHARLAVLAAQRSGALQAVRAAQGSDIALHRARIAEAGQLGTQIRAASEELERSGRTVTGTGEFVLPLSGHVTSAFGMRRHPILGHTKLHTGTDFAGGGTIAAADSGRVIMTVSSTAYGLFTVIDHGVIDGARVTTAYAHQSSFLVHEGQRVAKGDPIGMVGSTGYSTGPHLHFEVREDGAVVDPMAWLR